MLFHNLRHFTKWGFTMDILVRGIEPIFIKEIDKKASELTKKLGRNFSRNEYILMLIQNDCELRLTELKAQKFDLAVEHLIKSLERQEDKLQEFINSNNRVFYLLASGEDLEEGVEKI